MTRIDNPFFYVHHDVANFVTGNVLAMFLEFDAKPLVGRTMKPGAESFNHLSGKNLQVG